MQQTDEAEFKAEIDKISQRIESILEKVDEIDPSKAEKNRKPEQNH